MKVNQDFFSNLKDRCIKHDFKNEKCEKSARGLKTSKKAAGGPAISKKLTFPQPKIVGKLRLSRNKKKTKQKVRKRKPK